MIKYTVFKNGVEIDSWPDECNGPEFFEAKYGGRGCELVIEDKTAEIQAAIDAENAKKALKDKFKALKKSDIDTVAELSDAFLDLLKALDLK